MLQEMQKEHSVWVKHNFGDRPSWQPLLGIVEEFTGELTEARHAGTSSDVKDAIADTMIFMADFCTVMRFDLDNIFTVASSPTTEDMMEAPGVYVGRLAHSFLKKAQGIRGTPAEHDLAMKTALVGIIRHCVSIAHVYNFDLLEAVQQTWENVRRRDFQLYPKTGLP